MEPEKNTVMLSDGLTIPLKPFITRKAMMEIQKMTFSGATRSADGKVELKEFDIDASNKAQNYAVALMIDNGKTVEENLEFVENLPNADFTLLNEAVNKVLYPKTTEEKNA